MLESKSYEVELKDAEPDIIELLVEFAYTARYVFVTFYLLLNDFKYCESLFPSHLLFKFPTRSAFQVSSDYNV